MMRNNIPIPAFEELDDKLQRFAEEKSDRYAVRVARKLMSIVFNIPMNKTPKVSIHDICGEFADVCPIVLDVVTNEMSLTKFLTSRSSQLPVTEVLSELLAEYGNDVPIGVVCRSSAGDIVFVHDRYFDVKNLVMGDTAQHVDWVACRVIRNFRIYIEPFEQLIRRHSSEWYELLSKWTTIASFVERIGFEM